MSGEIAGAFVFAFIFGAIIGSFLNVVILRLPKGKSLGGRSCCPSCGHHLSAGVLVPLFSYVFLAGRCRYCRARISPRYFIIELATAALFALAVFMFPVSDTASLLVLLRVWAIIAVAIVVCVIDLEHFLILDRVLFPACLILLVLNFAVDVASRTSAGQSLILLGLASAAGLFLFFGALYIASKHRWIGQGDVKLALFIGLATPFPFIFLNVILASLIGTLIGLSLVIFAKKKLTLRMPFGSLLAVSTLLVLAIGPQLLAWYVHLIGYRAY